MGECYIEIRKGAARGTDSLAADAMRHLHARQYLGKAVLISEQPVPLLSAARKQWLKLSRLLQKQRAGTINADKILKFTHAITRMQHLGFSSKTPLDNPEADIYFLSPDALQVMPPQCWTVYVLAPLPIETAENLTPQLPPSALIVDYLDQPFWTDWLHLHRKQDLEHAVDEHWQQIIQLLRHYRIDVQQLNVLDSPAAMEDALETLLGTGSRFLDAADAFQHALELARPLRLSQERRAQYDAFILLAHRVQMLSPGAFGHRFINAYNEDDTYFLYDINRGLLTVGGEHLATAYARHRAAGRPRLAEALLRVAHAASVMPPTPPR